MADIRSVPAVPPRNAAEFAPIVSSMLNSDAWSPRDVQIRDAARLLRRLVRQAHPGATQLANAIAWDMYFDLGEPIYDLVKPLIQYSTASKGAAALARQIQDELQGASEEAARAALTRFRGIEGAMKVIRLEVTAVAALFPQLGLSFGYIGNVSTFCDDRSWRVFTSLTNRPGGDCSNIHFGGHMSPFLGMMAEEVRLHLRNWALRINADLNAGRAFPVSRAMAA